MGSEKKESIAIVGGGVAGLSVMWALGTQYQTTLFEKENSLGGQAQTCFVETPQGIIEADLAVQLFSEPVYPNLFTLFEENQVETFISPLSFSAHFPQLGANWSNVFLPQSEFGKSILKECDRFHYQMQRLPNFPRKETGKMSLGAFLEKNEYSTEFISGALIPMLSILAGTRASLVEYSLLYCMVLFNTGLLSFFNPPLWRRIKGGVQSHIDKLAKSCLELGTIKLGANIISVKREKENIQIVTSHGEKIYFDQVIFATSAEQALKLLDNPTSDEEKILGHFEYHSVSSVLHTDKNFFQSLGPIDRDFSTYPTCIYTNENETFEIDRVGTTTFNVNAYQCKSGIPFPILVSIDPKNEISSQKVIAERSWRLPKLRPQDMLVKNEMGKIQGVDRIWFCGLDSSTTGHESSFVSGLVISEAMGCKYPFEESPQAKSFYLNLQKIMGMNPETELVGTN